MVGLVGVGLVGAGLAMVYLPLALIAPGAALFAVAVFPRRAK